MSLSKALRLIAVSGVLVCSFARGQIWAPVPADRLEIVAGPVQTIHTKSSRQAAVRLLGRVGNSYGLRSAGRGYDLKVAFTVNSGGQTEEDGFWQMERSSIPDKACGGMPNPPPATQSPEFRRTALMVRTRGAIFHCASKRLAPLCSTRCHRLSLSLAKRCDVKCDVRRDPSAMHPPVRFGGSGRDRRGRWDESEECVDPHSGLLRVHSQVPGRYFTYDYSNAPGIAGHTFPSKVSVYEAGRLITEISVESLTETPAADSSLFVPTGQMRAAGPATALTGAQKIFHTVNQSPLPGTATSHVVCVFGVLTASGRLAEAHSLQPSDPASQAAVAAAREMTFDEPAQQGTRPRQHFVFIIESVSLQ